MSTSETGARWTAAPSDSLGISTGSIPNPSKVQVAPRPSGPEQRLGVTSYARLVSERRGANQREGVGTTLHPRREDDRSKPAAVIDVKVREEHQAEVGSTNVSSAQSLEDTAAGIDESHRLPPDANHKTRGCPLSIGEGPAAAQHDHLCSLQPEFPRLSCDVHGLADALRRGPQTPTLTELTRDPVTTSGVGQVNTMEVDITLVVDGERRVLSVDPRTTLLDALRERLGNTSPKKGCDHGQCGSCTVLLDRRRVTSCLALAVQYDGAEITTAQGLAADGELHPMQRAFLDNDGFQCGYCTPGQICSAIGMLEEAEAGWPSHVTADLTAPIEVDDAEISERMSGNICRCGAYAGIVQAIHEAAG